MTAFAEYFWFDQQGKFVKASHVSNHYEDMIVAIKKQDKLHFCRYISETPYWVPIQVTELDCAEVKELKAHLLLEGINL